MTTAHGRFEDRLRREVDAAVRRDVAYAGANIVSPLTTQVCQIALTTTEARAVLALVETAREVVRTRGSGPLREALARLDEASPR